MFFALMQVLDRVRKVLGYLTEDWVFLALLGTVMALLSMAIDITIESLQTCKGVFQTFKF